MGQDIQSQIEAEYDRLTRDTLRTWEQHHDVGDAVAPGYDPGLLGFSSGSRFSPNGLFAEFLAILNQAVASIDEVDVLPTPNFHFTFLALSPHEYSGPSMCTSVQPGSFTRPASAVQ